MKRLAAAACLLLAGCGSADTQLAQCRVEAAKLPREVSKFAFVNDCMKVAGYAIDWQEFQHRNEIAVKQGSLYDAQIEHDPTMWQKWYVQEVQGWFAKKPK